MNDDGYEVMRCQTARLRDWLSYWYLMYIRSSLDDFNFRRCDWSFPACPRWKFSSNYPSDDILKIKIGRGEAVCNVRRNSVEEEAAPQHLTGAGA